MQTNENTKMSPKEKRAFNKKYTILSSIVAFFIIFFAIFLYFMMQFNRLYNYNNQELSSITFEQQEFIDEFNETRQSYDRLFSNIDSVFWTNLAYYDPNEVVLSHSLDWTSDWYSKTIDEFSSIVNSDDIPFIPKRIAINEEMSSIISDINSISDDYDDVAREIWWYSFVNDEIKEVLHENNIQRAMLSIEAIRIFAALRVLSNIESFVSWFASFVWIDESQSSLYIEWFLWRWERDIQRFLTNCYLNPYENDRCTRYEDFHEYYQVSWDSDFDASIFINLMTNVLASLESEPWIISVVLNNMDHISNEISFTVEINTFQEDERSLARQWHYSPHSFISRELINSLRWSHFIVWESISIPSIETRERNIRIGWTDESKSVKSSDFRFTVPIQRVPEREIYDFVYDD